jgi:hypothetical protein
MGFRLLLFLSSRTARSTLIARTDFTCAPPRCQLRSPPPPALAFRVSGFGFRVEARGALYFSCSSSSSSSS